MISITMEIKKKTKKFIQEKHVSTFTIQLLKKVDTNFSNNEIGVRVATTLKYKEGKGKVHT